MNRLPETPTTEISDLLAAYALGALEPDERDFIARNLPRHPEWRRELEGYQSVATSLAYQLEPLDVPLRARAAVLVEIDAIESNIPLERHRRVAWNATLPPIALAKHTEPSRDWKRSLPRIALVMSMPAMLVAIVFAMYTVIIHSQIVDKQNELASFQQVQDESAEVLTGDSTSRQVIDLMAMRDAPFARGSLFIDRSENAAMLVARDLPPLDEDQSYVVWVETNVAEQEYARIGALEPNSAGTAQIVIAPPDLFASYVNVIVTRETDSEAARPTGAEILSGRINVGP